MNPSNPLDNSDSSDEDYVPDKKFEENLSEVESDGEPEDDPGSDAEGVSSRSRKRTKNPTRSGKKQKRMKSKCDSLEAVESEPATDEEKKKIEEDVWADFIKDTGFKSRKDRIESAECIMKKTESSETATVTSAKLEDKTPKKLTVTQVFNFAGEEVRVEKEVAEYSSEIKLVEQCSMSKITNDANGRSKGHISGISGILSQLSKKPKMSTLEKSKLDWDQFKKDENIEEELQRFNKGKDGYLEKQDFLNRADLRRFEIEKEIRTIERNKRVNN